MNCKFFSIFVILAFIQFSFFSNASSLRVKQEGKLTPEQMKARKAQSMMRQKRIAKLKEKIAQMTPEQKQALKGKIEKIKKARAQAQRMMKESKVKAAKTLKTINKIAKKNTQQKVKE